MGKQADVENALKHASERAVAGVAWEHGRIAGMLEAAGIIKGMIDELRWNPDTRKCDIQRPVLNKCRQKLFALAQRLQKEHTDGQILLPPL